MPGVALSHSERVVIEVGIGAGRSNPVIAAELGRPPCTIGREINRNGGRAKYRADKADRRAKRERCRPKQSRLEADPDLAVYVAGRLELLDSPMTIAIELARGIHGRAGLISHECIYQAIYQRRGLDSDIRRCLHLGRRRRKHRNTNCDKHSTHSLGDYRRIADRPKSPMSEPSSVTSKAT
jgi:IS30 family transposase